MGTDGEDSSKRDCLSLGRIFFILHCRCTKLNFLPRSEKLKNQLEQVHDKLRTQVEESDMTVPGNARNKVRASLAVRWTLGFYGSHSQTFAHLRIA